MTHYDALEVHLELGGSTVFVGHARTLLDAAAAQPTIVRSTRAK